MTSKEIDELEKKLKRERLAKEAGKPYWSLGITEKQFHDIYFGLGMDISIFKRKPQTDIDYRKNFANSKLWRMNHWYHIIDKDGEKIWFVMNYAQHKAYARQLRHGRSIILKSRQRGISTFFLIDYFDDAICLDNLTVGMQSYGLEESAALLEKLTVAWEELTDENKELLEIDMVKSNTKAMGFSNGSQIKVATSFRGTTLHRLHVSELGKIASKDPKKARELATGTLQAIKAGNPVAIESTAEGRYNAFFEWWYKAVDHVGDMALKDFDPVFMSWVDDPDCVADIKQLVSDDDRLELDKIEYEWADYDNAVGFKLTERQINWFVAARRELGDKFYQEYPHTPESAFDSVRDGAYYSRLWREEGHVFVETDSNSLYDPALLVHTAWDLGMNDMMVLVFFQLHMKEIRIVDEYHNHGEGLEHYAGVMRTKRKLHGYEYGLCILPHDAKVTDMTSATTRYKGLYDLGVRGLRVLKRTRDINQDIECVRRAIPNMWICEKRAGYIVKMMHRYSKKWDEILGAFRDKPLHDEWSNPADSVRYMVMGMLSYSMGDTGGSGGEAKTGSRKSDRTNVVDGMAL